MEYRGQQVVVTRDGEFQVQWTPGIQEDVVSFETYRAAKEAIDAALRTEKLNLPVMLSDGSRDILIGVHRNTSEVRLERAKNHRGEAAYAVADWLAEVLSTLRRLRRQERALEVALLPYRVPLSVGYGRLGMAEADKKKAELEKNWSRATGLAQSEPLDVEAVLAVAAKEPA